MVFYSSLGSNNTSYSKYSNNNQNDLLDNKRPEAKKDHDNSGMEPEAPGVFKDHLQ